MDMSELILYEVDSGVDSRDPSEFCGELKLIGLLRITGQVGYEFH